MPSCSPHAVPLELIFDPSSSFFFFISCRFLLFHSFFYLFSLFFLINCFTSFLILPFLSFFIFQIFPYLEFYFLSLNLPFFSIPFFYFFSLFLSLWFFFPFSWGGFEFHPGSQLVSTGGLTSNPCPPVRQVSTGTTQPPSLSPLSISLRAINDKDKPEWKPPISLRPLKTTIKPVRHFFFR